VTYDPAFRLAHSMTYWTSKHSFLLQVI